MLFMLPKSIVLDKQPRLSQFIPYDLVFTIIQSLTPLKYIPPVVEVFLQQHVKTDRGRKNLLQTVQFTSLTVNGFPIQKPLERLLSM